MKISRVSKSLALTAPLAVSVSQDLEAAAYIKFDGVDGESKESGFEGYVKIDFVKIEIQRTDDGRAGGIEFKNPVVRFPVEQASPTLMLACATGEILPSATVVLTRPDGAGNELAYYKITFTNVSVSSYSSTGTGGTAPPTEEVTLGYTEVEWTYIRYEGGKPVKTVSTQKISVPK